MSRCGERILRPYRQGCIACILSVLGMLCALCALCALRLHAGAKCAMRVLCVQHTQRALCAVHAERAARCACRDPNVNSFCQNVRCRTAALGEPCSNPTGFLGCHASSWTSNGITTHQGTATFLNNETNNAEQPGTRETCVRQPRLETPMTTSTTKSVQMSAHGI